MCTINSFNILKSQLVDNNLNQGSYRPRFFELKDFELSKVYYNSTEYSTGNAERELLIGDYSFAYLREDKIRTIDVFDSAGCKIGLDQFSDKFGIKINSTNLFKTGKYLSRVFRPVRYAKHFSNIKVHINENPKLMGKVTDGISLISLSLARVLGWEKAKPGMSAQFTLFFGQGLVKGHCVVSDKIAHDVVVYGDDNIKTEIGLNERQYISVEPVKLSKKLRMDIQSLLNLWNLFGGEQYLEWAYSGIQEFKQDLLSGKLNNWLDDFDEIDAEEYENETWTLRQAIRHKLDYTRFPGLVRQGFSMFRSSMRQFALTGKGEPTFRIPVPGGLRGYIRVDLRNHDADGNFTSDEDIYTVHLDTFGNLWIHPDSVAEFMEIKGGGDMDDGVAIIPVENNQAVIYRNPNQYGEYGIHTINYEDIVVEKRNNLIGSIPQRKIIKEKESAAENKISNPMLISILSKLPKPNHLSIEYKKENLLRMLIKISESSTSIGLAANAEMIRSAIGITDKKLFEELTSMFNWNLERIIDATIKDGTNASEDMQAVSSLLNYIIDKNIQVPRSLAHRFSEKMRKHLKYYDNHPLDNLLDAIKYFLDAVDLEILGKGAASRGNRIPGIIDNLDIPLIEIGMANIDNLLDDLASSILKNYNKNIAILLESTNDLDIAERELMRKEGIERIQTELLQTLEKYTDDDRKLLVQNWAYNIYRSERSPHDSILWIGDKGDLAGTTQDTISMLAALGIAHNVEFNHKEKKRTIIKTQIKTSLTQVRVWSKDSIDAHEFSDAQQLLIVKKDVMLNETVLKLGDECEIEDGLYKIKTVVQSKSKKHNGYLKNSITIYLS